MDLRIDLRPENNVMMWKKLDFSGSTETTRAFRVRCSEMGSEAKLSSPFQLEEDVFVLRVTDHISSLLFFSKPKRKTAIVSPIKRVCEKLDCHKTDRS